MFGFLLIDKPKGIPSFDCVRALRRKLQIRRIGFAGTLDPLASGLMIIALGEATKLLHYLEKMDKVYEAEILFGAVSTTCDAEGEIEAFPAALEPQKSEVEKVLEDDFSGPRMQVPPIFSAIKINGQRAYDLARKGIEVEMKERHVNFYDIQILSYVWPKLKLKVYCSSGTYIRSLAHDLGQKLNCGGYINNLKRTKIGRYKLDDAAELDAVDLVSCNKYLIPPQVMFSDWEKFELSDNEYFVLGNGGVIDRGVGVSLGSDELVSGSFMGSKMPMLVGQPIKSLYPILAIYKGKCAGVMENVKGKLKFLKKFNNM